MKKTYIFIIIMIIFFLIYYNFNDNDVLLRMKEEFKIIDEKSLNVETIDRVVFKLKEYLTLYDLTSEDIKKISPNIRIFEDDNARIIEYIQPPNIYGNSAKESWKILQYKEYSIVVIFEENMPLELIDYRIIESNDIPILYTYNINYEVNHRKIQIFAYTITDSGLEKRQSLSKVDMESEAWNYNTDFGLIWNKKNFNIFISSISKNGEKIKIESIDEKVTNKY